MTRPQRRLWLALSFSLIAHLLTFLPFSEWLKGPARPPAPALQAKLRLPPPTPTPLVPPLILPEIAREAVKPVLLPEKSTAQPRSWQSTLKKQLRQPYSAEAIALRLEGEVIVRIFFDADGNVSAARVEESSGQPILDRDAVNAVRALPAQAANIPRDLILPLRFRLKE